MKKTPKVEVNMKIEAEEIHRRKVVKFGTGGAHIVFSKDHIGKEVIIILVENGQGINKKLERRE